MTSIQLTPRILLISNEDNKNITSALKQAGFKIEVVNEISSAESSLKMLKPDLILIYSEMTGDHGLNFCGFVKTIEITPRPVIVFLVHENNPDERVEVLRAGADDVISYPISGKEIAFRVMAHIRRRHETHVNLLTGLPDAVIIGNILEHCLAEIDNWAVLSIDLDNLRVYNEAYGEARGDQMIKALAAVLKSVLSGDDFLAHRDSDDFLLVVRNKNAEAIAEEICRRFDFIAPRFYTKEDAQRGYVIGVGPKGIRRRIPLVSISIGVTAKGRRNFLSALEVLQAARDMRYLAKSKNGSDWVSDRLRLPVSEQIQTEKRIKILVIEPDASMSLLLRDTLELEGYVVEVAHSTNEAWYLINNWRPELILLETEIVSSDTSGWDLARKIKQDPNLASIWLVMSTKSSDYSKALECGCDLYLPKPYELQVLFSEIRYLLRARIKSSVLII
ncbi:MAG: response regulator [Candidatus Melainabacteria bacterium]|nr:response regulator [Candidatus Melainabacteria bacterium]